MEIDDYTAGLLNLRSKDLSTTLILHTMFGKDHFISISGEFRQFYLFALWFALTNELTEYTCFANKLERLTRLPRPARSLGSPNDLLPESQSRNAPTELMRLINWMMTNPASTVNYIQAPLTERDK